jgi:excisionase family DNA binding protein
MYKKYEVATELRVSLATINRLISLGQLKSIKIGRCVRITEQQLQEFISRNEVN